MKYMKQKIGATIALSAMSLLSLSPVFPSTAIANDNPNHKTEDKPLSSRAKSEVESGANLRQADWNDSTGTLDKPESTSKDEVVQNYQSDNNGEQLTRVIFTTDETNKIADRIFASAPSQVVDEDSGRTSLEWYANIEESGFDWWTPDPALKWNIFRDGKKVDTVTGGNYVDTKADRSENHQYSITASYKNPNRKEEAQEDIFNYGVNIPAAPQSAVGLDIDDPKVLSLKLNSDIAGQAVNPQALRPTALQYGSFIPDKRIDRPAGCTPTKYEQFAGDDRGFATKKNPDWDKLRYRIRNMAYIDWSGNTAKLSEASNTVGTTRAYIDGKEVAKAKASTKKVKTSLTSAKGGKAEISFKQAASDPLCKAPLDVPAPDINADVVTTIAKASGTVTARGRHDGAPNHEILMRNTAGGDFDQGCVYRYYRGDFTWLAPPEDVQVDVTINPTGNWNWSCPVYEKGKLEG